MYGRFSTLRSALLLPFVLIVTAVAMAIAMLSYWTGKRATDSLTAQLLGDIANRVTQATQQHLATSKSVLAVVAPNSISTPSVQRSLTPQSLELIEERLWIASGLFPNSVGNVFYGTEQGAFVGLNRSGDIAELRIRESNSAERQIFTSFAPGSRTLLLRTDSFDPRGRPWYKAAQGSGALTWSPTYLDATTKALTVTLAKPIYNAQGEGLGVFATDIALTQLSDFFGSLQISQTGVAFMIEPSGQLIATSIAEPLYRVVDGQQQRVLASESSSPLIRAAYQSIAHATVTRGTPVVDTFKLPDGDEVNFVAQSQVDEAALNWIMVVAVPRSDQMAAITRTVKQSAVIGAVAVLIALGLALWMSHRIGADVSRLAQATHLLARGDSPTPSLFAGRRDEIGKIARAMQEFSTDLLTDPLTGALNRPTFEKRFNALVAGHSATNPVRFALVFVDMNDFKQINDEHGHAVGDAVLAVSARRLAGALRKRDLLARFGGDEFLLLLSNVHTEQHLATALRRLKAQLSPAVQIAGAHIHAGASCGGALFPQDGETLDALIKVADERMFAAKRALPE